MSENDDGLIRLATDIVSAYVATNSVPATDLPTLIASTHGALRALGNPESTAPVTAKPLPAVSIRKSITRDAMICLEDGKKFKSLKRHLGAAHGMTPEQYRDRWDLPGDYPMVAPVYAEARSELAKKIGLGKPRKGGRGTAA